MLSFLGGAVVKNPLQKNPSANADVTKDEASIAQLGRSPEVGNVNPLQYSCLGNVMDRAAWWAAVHEVTVRHN